MILISDCRFICVKELQKTKKCEDFEVRFCCPKQSYSTTPVPLTDSTKTPFSVDVYKKFINSTLPKDYSELRKLKTNIPF